MNEEPRLFVAVPLDEEARSAVVDLVERIRATEPEGRGVRWVRLDGLHITLRFLGPTPELRVSTSAALASTLTCSVTAPTLSATSTAGSAFTCNSMPDSTALVKPSRLTSNRYGPRGKFVSTKPPSAALVVVRVTPVAVWVALTSAPGTAAPVES